jgi:DNA repair protein RadD
MTELRSYQRAVIAEYNQVIANGQRRVIVVVPTGAGKTIIATSIIREAAAENKRILLLACSREIIKQTSLKLSSQGIEHGIIQAGLVADLGQSVQVASVQTLWSRAMRTDRMLLPAADLLIVDEAHHCPANTYRRLIESYPAAILIGLTATPCRGDGRGLGGIFDTLVEGPQIQELIDLKFLVRTRVYAPVEPDLKGVQTRQGDYVEAQLADRMDRDNLVGDIIGHWHKFGEGRKTVCFAVNVRHSIHIRNEFIKSGVRAEHLDGTTPKPVRDAILARLTSGETELVTNCQVLGEGWDLPEVGCAILARPTKKMGLYRQMVGRVLRPALGKFNAIVLDHSGAVFRHGFVEDRVVWTLNPDKRAGSPVHAARLVGRRGPPLLECSQCTSIRVAGEACQHCGFFPQRPPRNVSFLDGDLGLVDRKSRSARVISDPDERMRWLGMLTSIGAERGYKQGWAAYKYKEKFGTWPPAKVAPIPPSPEVRSWVRSRDIAYAKARQKAAGVA